MTLRHTPFDGSAPSFAIGLKPIPPARWLEPDDGLARDLSEKSEHFAKRANIVWREREDTRGSQAEIRDALVDHLVSDHGALFARSADGLDVAGVGAIALDGPPLLAISRCVQDDLVLMRKDDDGWRLAAASLCFPSSWSLAEKFDRPMDDIHRHVPGYAGQMQARIDRIFDHLKPGDPVERFNWSVYDDGDLHHPAPKQGRKRWDAASGVFVRAERQTLRKMAISGDILFTIKVDVEPLALVASRPNASTLLAGLREGVLRFDADQLRYKGIVADRDTLLQRIDEALAALP